MEFILSYSKKDFRFAPLLFLYIFGDVRVICSFFPTWSLVLKLLSIGPVQCLILIRQGESGRKDDWAREYMHFPPFYLQRYLDYSPLGRCQRRWKGQKPSCRCLPEGLWKSGFQLQKVCRLNVTRKGVGSRGQDKAGFSISDPMERKTRQDPAVNQQYTAGTWTPVMQRRPCQPGG